MILDEVYKEIFKFTNPADNQRKFVCYVDFIRDPRTGLHGLVLFKHNEYQFWTISDYANAFKASLNLKKFTFTAPLTDISQIGRGNDISILITTVLSKVYHFQFDNETEQLTPIILNLSNAIFTRQLPNRSALIAATHDGKLAKYSIEGHLQTLVEIPNSPLPKFLAISPNGRNAAIGDRSGKLYIFDLDVMEAVHTIDTQSGAVTCIAFSQDGNQILVGSKQPVIKLFSYEDLGTWTCVRCFMHHSSEITAVVLSTGMNVERFASASSDGTVCIWSFANEEPVHVVRLKDEFATTVNFSPDGCYLAVGTDEGSLRVYRTPFTSDYSEPQYFIDEQIMKENFWELEGNSVFDPLALRKSLGIFNDQTESLIFLKLEANPLLKLREAYHRVAEASAERLEGQNAELQKLRRERRRQRRRIAFESKVEQMRLAAAREGREFVPPETPPFSEEDDGNLDELSDIEAMFERIEPPRLEPAQREENNEGFVDPFDSPLSSPASNADQRSGGDERRSQSPRSGSEPEGKGQQMPVGLDMLSDSDEDEQQNASGHEPTQEEESPIKSPKSSDNPEEAPGGSPDQGQLWASDDDEDRQTGQFGQRKTPQSDAPNDDVDMDDLTAENDEHAEMFVRKTPTSNSKESSPIASPQNETESP